jgi:hypothetical protein
MSYLITNREISTLVQAMERRLTADRELLQAREQAIADLKRLIEVSQEPRNDRQISLK